MSEYVDSLSDSSVLSTNFLLHDFIDGLFIIPFVLIAVVKFFTCLKSFFSFPTLERLFPASKRAILYGEDVINAALAGLGPLLLIFLFGLGIGQISFGERTFPVDLFLLVKLQTLEGPASSKSLAQGWCRMECGFVTHLVGVSKDELRGSRFSNTELVEVKVEVWLLPTELEQIPSS